MFKDRKINYKIFLLQPEYVDAVERSKTRTCHKSITPEVWIKHFYDELSIFNKQDNEDLIIFNNSYYSVEECADKILLLLS
jgi:hypothetical protein